MSSLDHRICSIICNVIREMKDLSSLLLIRLEIYIAIRGEGLTHAQEIWYIDIAISYFIFGTGREQLEQMSKEEPVREDAALPTRAATDLSDKNFSAPGSTANVVEAEEMTLGDLASKASEAMKTSRGMETPAREDKMRKEESAKLDSASLRPDTLAQKLISTAFRENKRKEESVKLDSASLCPDTLAQSTASRKDKVPSKFPLLVEPYRRAIFTCRQCFQVICRRHRPGVIFCVLIHHGCRPPAAPNLKVTESIFRRTRDRSNFGG